jgi:hypothetical protein
VTAESTSTAPEPITYCARHPSVETALRCGRCDTPICPSCLVYTPGGTRCPDCAQLRRPVMYELAPLDIAKAASASAVVAVVLGVAGTILLAPGRGLPFGFFLAILIGAGAGALMAEAITRATRAKRGRTMQLVAAGGLVAAWLLRLALAGALSFLLGDVLGGIALAASIVTAWQRLA